MCEVTIYMYIYKCVCVCVCTSSSINAVVQICWFFNTIPLNHYLKLQLLSLSIWSLVECFVQPKMAFGNDKKSNDISFNFNSNYFPLLFLLLKSIVGSVHSTARTGFFPCNKVKQSLQIRFIQVPRLGWTWTYSLHTQGFQTAPIGVLESTPSVMF